DIKKAEEIGPYGFDKVEFLISTNPGEPLMPLTRIASGGEISRIMLAFKHIIGESDSVETMIFDEIDTGISGKAALVVGKKLSEIAKHRQILSVTHLP
ncbi:MAG: DNA repair protein RecN, partial [Mogibacterium sp.]|nr:DNA repair protein RecN [Mogibacterium sp.]